MSARREFALQMIERLAVHLRTYRGPLRLSREERRFLLDALDAAAAGDADPFGTGRSVGGQARVAAGLQEAAMVHERIKTLGTLRAACEAVGAELNRDGSKSGAVEKNYRKHRPALSAADRFYAARNAGRVPDAADIAAMINGSARGN